MFEEFFLSLKSQSYLEWIAVLTGLIYIYLATRNKPECWYWGIVSCGIWMFCTWFEYRLLADSILQAFYVGMGFIGLYKWKFQKEKAKVLPISSLTITEIIYWVAGGLIASFLIGYFLAEYTQAAATYLDSLTTIFSLVATVWLVRRKIDNWILWILADLTYVYLYFSRDAILFAILFMIYTAFAAYGFIHWRKHLRSNLSSNPGVS